MSTPEVASQDGLKLLAAMGDAPFCELVRIVFAVTTGNDTGADDALFTSPELQASTAG